ncbi:hypothetical protein PC120_g27591 [Phytophthora cactorum]|nr:hypothetical protein PC120_g27591 [Phytophthora cactorum]
MDLSYATDEEAELLAAEQRTSIRRCYTCVSTRHIRVSCPVRNQRKAPPSQASGSSRGNGDSQRRGAPYWGRTEFCWAYGRQRTTGPSSEERWALV